MNLSGEQKRVLLRMEVVSPHVETSHIRIEHEGRCQVVDVTGNAKAVVSIELILTPGTHCFHFSCDARPILPAPADRRRNLVFQVGSFQMRELNP